MEQQTLASAFTLKGAGIHTGAMGRVTVHPAEADTGRVFRVDRICIPARADFVVDTARCTTLGMEGAQVRTVEHLLSALHGLNIDNAVIEVQGPEIPILDGSALPFVEAIQSVGILGQGRTPRTMTPVRSLQWEEGASRMHVCPFHTCILGVEVAFAEWPQGDAFLCALMEEPPAVSYYCTSIAPARTFALLQEVELLRAAGLAQGGTLDNALIITPPDTFSTPLRMPFEWCVHKMLDVIGDLALLDARSRLHLMATRPGHRMNVRLAAELLAQAQETQGN